MKILTIFFPDLLINSLTGYDMLGAHWHFPAEHKYKDEGGQTIHPAGELHMVFALPCVGTSACPRNKVIV